MGLAAFKIFSALDAGVDELPDSYHADGFDLLHLQWTVIPSSRSEAPLKHQSTVNAYRITQDYLTVDDATDQATDVLEDHLSLSSIL
jgi:hypothetical protein